LRDFGIGHQVDLFQYSNNVVRRIIALLNRTDSDISTQLQLALEQLPAGQFTVERLEFFLATVKATNAQAYQAIGAEMTSVVRELAEYEAWYQAQLFEYVMPPQVVASVGVATVNVQQAYAAALARPFQGRLLREWYRDLERGAFERLRNTIRAGIVEGRTIEQLVREIRGTKAQGYADGILETTRRAAETTVRTAVAHTANVAREVVYAENPGLIKGVKWTSTLDGRTSAVCRARDGQVYPVGVGPRPPAHPNCRSSTVPVLKSWQEMGLAGLPPGTRASMNGQVPEDQTYDTWLRNQPVAFQEEVLGVTKARLFRAGLTLDRYVNRAGDEYTLDELRQRERAAFETAGLSA
jgi:SPP1 gp7 family putative phage head morphogenesis protein